MDQMFYSQFNKVQVYDLQLSLSAPADPAKVYEAGAFLEGVSRAEAVYTAAARISDENRSEFGILYALQPGSEMWYVRDYHGRVYQPPADGVVLNGRIAKKLGVAQGDLVEISIPALSPRSVPLRINAVIDETFGGGCYMDIHALSAWFPTAPVANTLLLNVEDGHLDALKARLRETGFVSWMVDARKVLKSYQTMMESMSMMIDMFSLLAVAAGVVLIYNISMISIRERGTELGTIMLFGGTRREIGGMLLKEQLFYFAGGVLLGFPGGYAVQRLLEKILVSESYVIDIHATPFKYAESFFICLAITLIAWYAQSRYLQRIPLTEILKERES
jgi:putative ABC transport system permease protein